MKEKNNSAAVGQKDDAKTPSKKSHSSSSHHHHSSTSSSHHHHSSTSSSHHHHHSSSSKSSKKKTESNSDHSGLKMFFSFLLFLSIAATAVFAGLKITVVNENRVAEIFTNSEYVNALYNDVLDYSKDMCLKCSIPQDSINDVITYKAVSDIESAYINGVFNKDEKYSETTYSDMINELKTELETSTKNMISANGLEISEKQTDTGVQTFSQEIASYIKERVEFEFASNIQSVLNVSSPVTNIGIILFAVFSLAFFLLAISIEGKNYRSLRPVAFSFLGAALLNLLLVAFVGIVAIFKDLVIYPSYLCNSVMQYIYSCVLTFLFIAFLLFVVGIVICTLVWKLKRNNE